MLMQEPSDVYLSAEKAVERGGAGKAEVFIHRIEIIGSVDERLWPWLGH